MRIFVVEYITGGGLMDGELPAGLLQEAGLMLEALVGDLLEVEGVELLVSRDRRLPPLTADCSVYVPHAGEDIWDQWSACIDRCDAVWPVMPETGGLMARISRLACERGRQLAGSTPEAVALAASKYRTLQVLRDNGVPAVPAYRRGDTIPAIPGHWLLKPDDGVGCEGIKLLAGHEAARRALEQSCRAGYVVQPWADGESASLCVLCEQGTARLLSVNRLAVAAIADGFGIESIVVNARPHAREACAALARAVARAQSGLWGYVGIDVLLTGNGPVVLEVNPRLTVSYAGLHSALGVNPALLVIRMLRGEALPAREYSGSDSIRIELGVAHVA